MIRNNLKNIIPFLFIGLVTASCGTKKEKVSVITTEPSVIKQAGAVSGGTISASKKTIIIQRGVCWDNRHSEPSVTDNCSSDGAGSGTFISILNSLRPGDSYYVRAYAITESDTLYGNMLTFNTADYGTMKDIDGNEYRTITIGDQTWMAANLAVTRYRDGTAITLVKDTIVWASITKPAYTWYRDEKATFMKSYGALYNGYTIDRNGLCPAGWHIPSDLEWAELAGYAGGEAYAGGNLKERGTAHWVRPNAGAKDILRFTALPGGLRYSDGAYHDLGFGGYWWTSAVSTESRRYFRFLYYQDSCIFQFENSKKLGFSVRCIKDK